MATVDAIFEATIQVLLVEGPRKLTTTRVAERSGVSIGTMYQYFPNKQALFYALNERYLENLAQKVEASCTALHGALVRDMVSGLVATYWDAKMENPAVTRVLYRSIAELDNKPLIEAFSQRVDRASAVMFASACDMPLADQSIVNLTLLTTIFGAVRNAFERDLSLEDVTAIREQLVLMCVAYLQARSQS
ncbi:TetR/AcrR family transcriptional regulator [Dyella sp.]|uniref:TetR/AcrR family transcriptional regulator n=1 Tax=Dyella sp. TaxID=1869338 RepID=UPI002ED252D8